MKTIFILLNLSLLTFVMSGCNNQGFYKKIKSNQTVNSIPQSIDDGVLLDNETQTPSSSLEDSNSTTTTLNTTSSTTNSTQNQISTTSNTNESALTENPHLNINDLLDTQPSSSPVNIADLSEEDTIAENEIPALSIYPEGVEVITESITTPNTPNAPNSQSNSHHHTPYTPPQNNSTYSHQQTYEQLRPTDTGPSNFIKYAFWVVKNEAEKIGTPCNFYVSRVLRLAGYSKDSFLANDFQYYAKKNFSSYKDESFDTNYQSSERIRLKKYIWSFPERTPFIVNWVRPGNHGHIAIVERIDNSLITYQAKMGKSIAKREQTTVDIMMGMIGNRGYLTVYSQFIPR